MEENNEITCESTNYLTVSLVELALGTLLIGYAIPDWKAQYAVCAGVALISVGATDWFRYCQKSREEEAYQNILEEKTEWWRTFISNYILPCPSSPFTSLHFT